MPEKNKELFEEPSTALAVHPDGPAVSITPAAMLQLAASKDVDPDKLQKLMDFAERYQANLAKMAFNAAMMAFKTDALRISRNITYSDGPLKGKKYADLFGVVDKLTPALSSHGLSASWRVTKDEPAWLEVTCTIRHEAGHSESVSMGGEPDKGPARNAITARGSSVTYLERYTLLAAVGMAVAGQDDDAQQAGAKLGDQEYIAFMENIEYAATKDELRRFYETAYKAAEKVGDKGAMTAFIKAKDAAKERLAQ